MSDDVPVDCYSDKIILIAPLDWGFGHTTRCVPLISRLRKNNRVVLGTTDRNASFYARIFPELEQLAVPSWNIRYSSWLPAWVAVLLRFPRLILVLKKERSTLRRYCMKYKPDIIISDSRPGFKTKGVINIFLSHQLQLKIPLLYPLANRSYKSLLRSFDEVWVPDHEEIQASLAGKLSRCPEGVNNLRYIGPLSHLQKPPANSNELINCLVVLSGPEPQRTILENLLLLKLEGVNGVVFVSGKDQYTGIGETTEGKILFAEAAQLSDLLVRSKVVICRSGYSTLMDLDSLGVENIVLIPTPGQPEQEYLAEWWKQKRRSKIIVQKELRGMSRGELWERIADQNSLTP